jgi:cytochrome b6-f complex iron-sulfur subunit
MEQLSQSTDARRRSLLQYLTTFFLSLWAVGIGGVVVGFLRTPSPVRWAGQNIVRGGEAGSLRVGEGRLIRHGGAPLYVVRLTNEEIVALSGLCTHFRCVLNWNSQNRTLVCPCHNGVFNATGDVMSGLPTRSLTLYPTEIRRGEILIHL